MDLDTSLPDAVKAIHYIYPALVSVYFIVATTGSICTFQALKASARSEHVRRDLLLSLMCFMALSYVIEVLAVGLYDLIHMSWNGKQDYNIYLLASSIIWGILVLSLPDAQITVWFPYLVPWFLGFVSELFLIIVSNILKPPESWLNIISIVLQALRISALGLLWFLYVELRTRKHLVDDDPERQSLLRRNLRPNYDTIGNGNDDSDTNPDPDVVKKNRETRKKISARQADGGSWINYIRSYSIFFPMIFPLHERMLQARIVMVALCLMSKNGLNLLLPIQTGRITTAILDNQGIWTAVAIHGITWFFSYGYIIDTVQMWLWKPVQNFASNGISLASFRKVMSLSSDFHDGRNPIVISQILQQGESVTEIMDQVCFSVVPMSIDLVLITIYLYTLFGPYMLMCLMCMIPAYLFFSSSMVKARKTSYREYRSDRRKLNAMQNDGISGWHNAVYFNRIPYETERYDNMLKAYTKAKTRYSLAASVSRLAQGLMVTVFFTAAIYIATYQVVVSKVKSVSDLVILLSCFIKLVHPLNFLAGLHKDLSEKMMDAERLLEIFNKESDIREAPNAKSLEISEGHITFDKVKFIYKTNPETDDSSPEVPGLETDSISSEAPVPILAIDNISFEVPGGSKVALVGESGGGKSTLLKLLWRFYDVTEGSILIDGQDIRDVTVDSILQNLSSVAQDPMLFNDTIMNNIRYANLTSTDEEVYEVCRAAKIHDKVLKFPNGYQSKVGDKGIKLSGGEKQRIAIARALLKKSRIILLDEATSAVDMLTEDKIQQALEELCKDKTTITVAHRLATVLKADRIFVIGDGKIVEEGTHDSLVKKGGKYFQMWDKGTFIKPLDGPELLE